MNLKNCFTNDTMQKSLIQIQTIQGPIFGTCYNETQLSAKFQVWARNVCGVTDRDSLAYLVCNNPERWAFYFQNEIEMLRYAAECERRISLFEMPKDFGTAVKESKICHAVLTIYN